MKKKIASLLTAIAVLASGAASIGCVFIVFDEHLHKKKEWVMYPFP